jgi:hypothetical protein
VASSGRRNSETIEDSKEIDYYAFHKVTNLLTHNLVLAPSWLPMLKILQAPSFPADFCLELAYFQADSYTE